MSDTKHILQYVGGKFYLADWILEHFPPHQTYVEPFGGAAHVLLQKKKSNVEIYNDLNSDLVNLFLIARDDSQVLYNKLNELPYSRELYYQWLYAWKLGIKPIDPIERAVVFFYLQNSCVSGNFGGGFGTSTLRNHAKKFFKKVNNISTFRDRFKNVVIENLDYKDLIEKYDSKDTLFYCDPPYLNTQGFDQWDETKHKELAHIINKVNGKVLLTHYEHSLFYEMYPRSRWVFDKLDHVIYAEKDYNAPKSYKTTLLSCNFDFNKEARFIDKAQTRLVA